MGSRSGIVADGPADFPDSSITVDPLSCLILLVRQIIDWSVKGLPDSESFFSPHLRMFRIGVC
jgi:hypothetical protein